MALKVWLLYAVFLQLFCSNFAFMHVKKKCLVSDRLPCGVEHSIAFLTPYLERGEIEKAKNVSKAKPLTGSVESYTGFLTVNRKFNSSIFFWYFPASESPETAPLTVWLQGGPGISSMYALFFENGPYQLNGAGNGSELSLRQYSWTKTMSMIYFDNPVGTGFSMTDGGYSKSQKEVGENLYKALIQFYQLFPDLLQKELYLLGESYAGKYIPSFAIEIHNKNKKENVKINLKGIAIGNGLTDPINMCDYGSFLYELGLIDQREKQIFDQYRDQIIENIKAKKYVEAIDIWDTVIEAFDNTTGSINIYNYLAPDGPELDVLVKFFDQDSIRDKINVGDLPYKLYSEEAAKNLRADEVQSVAPVIVDILENDYQVMFFSGQFDVMVSYPATLKFLQNLKWKKADEYRTAARHVWKLNDKLAGYVKVVGNLFEVLVRNSGHMVPTDQPEAGFDMINKFVFKKPFF